MPGLEVDHPQAGDKSHPKWPVAGMSRSHSSHHNYPLLPITILQDEFEHIMALLDSDLAEIEELLACPQTLLPLPRRFKAYCFRPNMLLLFEVSVNKKY